MDQRQHYKDYYYILGVTPEATSEEIREAYMELYERFGPHVSVSGQDPDQLIRTFKDITEAYETLMNPEARKNYDQSNLPHLQKTHLRALWGKIAGVDPTKEPGKADAPEHRVELEVTLREAYKGSMRKIRIEELLPCAHCAGLKPMNRLQCQHCRGAGSTMNRREEEIELPKGLFDKAEIRKPGRGKFDMRAGKNSDLVLVIGLKHHSFFNVLGRDVACTVPVTLYEAVLGGEIECPTPTGKVIMKIQPLTHSGRVYRLKGLGLGGADLLMTVEVQIPSQLTPEEVELFRKLKNVSAQQNPRETILARLSNEA